jgi:predicted HTH domain antitoxin
MDLAIANDLIEDLHLTAEQVRLDLAVGLFSEERVTLGRAARIAGLSEPEFLRELGRRRIPVHYDVADFAADMATLRVMDRNLSVPSAAHPPAPCHRAMLLQNAAGRVGLTPNATCRIHTPKTWCRPRRASLVQRQR